MKIKIHSPREFADALKALLPEGDAWVWAEGSTGDDIMLATAQELARIDADAQDILDQAIEIHRPKAASWHIDEYRRIASEAIAGTAETMPRRIAVIGSHIGDRLWSHDAPEETFPIDLLQVEHLFGPARIGSHIGDGLWGHRSRYIIRVRYYRSVVDPKPLWDALSAFKQAHVFLWFEDISGAGGQYGQN
ncbi:hypothetical protein [Herbaspirillum chlorophenolicum]|uniref:hypothetical protein n=1 Tax=Herbaspirillum chlorophenolicum TaxID=211589 RepID=UPI00067CA0E9|nr:hypothetical protein [Herbaspirillum chlorophenolicum]